MRTSAWQQLEAFASWHKRSLSTPQGQNLWGVDGATEERLMNQAPLYVLNGEPVDFYAEAVLSGTPRVDLSAQYSAASFVPANLLQGRSVEREGDFFHYYAKTLDKRKPALLPDCTLYLEADIGEGTSPEVSSFVNLSGDFVEEILPLLLKYRGREIEETILFAKLRQVKFYGEPWHIGFMEAREEKPLRLVLYLHHGLSDIPLILEKWNAPCLDMEAMQLLEEIDKTHLFSYMLDLDILPDGSLGPTVGVELLVNKATWPEEQQRLMQTDHFQSFIQLLLREGLSDQRIQGITPAISETIFRENSTVYSRISHFKLRWQAGLAMPAKVYVQIRNDVTPF